MIEIQVRGDLVVGVDNAHNALYEVGETDPLYPHLTQFFSKVAQHAPSNVRYKFRPIPHHRAPTSLRERGSIGSFSGVSLTTHHTTIHTPRTSSSEAAQTNCELSNDNQDAVTTAGPESVQLPFSYFAGKSRNPQFYGREDILE